MNKWLCVSALALSTGLASAPSAFAQETPDEPVEEIIIAHERYDPVRVLGDRIETDPGSVASANAELIADIAADHPAEILNTLPGVNIQMNSGQEHLLAIRSPVFTGGAGQGSFLILENGVPTRSPAFGNVNILIEPHHEVATAIEVVRGPGSARQGSNAVHGLINVILPDPYRTYESTARVSYGSLGRARGDIALANREHELGINASIMHDNGWRDDTGVDQQKLSLAKGVYFGDWDGQVWFSASNLEQETGGFLRGTDAYEDASLAKTNPNPEAWRNAWSARLGARLETDMAGGLVTVTPFVRTQSMQFAQHFLPNGGVEKNGHTGGGFQLAYENRPSNELTYTIGLDTDFASGWLKEIQPEPFGFFPGDGRFPQGLHYDYTVDTTMLGLWGELDWEIADDIKLLAGLRGETHEYDYSTDAPVGINGRFNVVADRSDSFDLLTPKLGIIYTPADTSYYANYARGERAPQASDLYRLQSQQVAGEIETETLDSFEIGIRRAYGDHHIYFDVAAYWMEKDNFFFRDSDRLNVPNGKSEHKGIEAQVSWEPSDSFTLSTNVTYGEHKYAFNRTADSIQSGNFIDTAPKWLADLRADWDVTEALRLTGSVEHIGEYYTNAGNTAEYPGHTILNAGAEYALDDAHSLRVNIRNLADERYADRADFAFGGERYFPGEPANVTVSLKKTF